MEAPPVSAEKALPRQNSCIRSECRLNRLAVCQKSRGSAESDVLLNLSTCLVRRRCKNTLEKLSGSLKKSQSTAATAKQPFKNI